MESIKLENIDKFKFDLNNKDGGIFISYLSDYICSQKTVIVNHGETISFGSWMVKINVENGIIIPFELDPNDINSYRKGLDYSIDLIKSQILLCERFGISPQFTMADKLVSYYKDIESNGVIKYGLKSEQDNNVSGIILWTENSPENIKDILHDHAYHFVDKMPWVMQILSIPVGYRFSVDPDSNISIWKDEISIK